MVLSYQDTADRTGAVPDPDAPFATQAAPGRGLTSRREAGAGAGCAAGTMTKQVKQRRDASGKVIKMDKTDINSLSMRDYTEALVREYLPSLSHEYLPSLEQAHLVAPPAHAAPGRPQRTKRAPLGEVRRAMHACAFHAGTAGPTGRAALFARRRCVRCARCGWRLCTSGRSLGFSTRSSRRSSPHTSSRTPSASTTTASAQ